MKNKTIKTETAVVTSWKFEDWNYVQVHGRVYVEQGDVRRGLDKLTKILNK